MVKSTCVYYGRHRSQQRLRPSLWKGLCNIRKHNDYAATRLDI